MLKLVLACLATGSLLLPLAAQQADVPAPAVAAIDVLMDRAATATQLNQAVEQVRAAEFAVVVPRLLAACAQEWRRRDRSPLESGIGPRTKTPWLETDLLADQRVQYTLHQLWFEKVRTGVSVDEAAVLVTLIEDDKLGELRHNAVWPLDNQLGELLRVDAEPTRALLVRLEKVATVDATPGMRADALKLVLRHVPPDRLQELAWAIVGAAKTPAAQADLLSRTRLLAELPRLSPVGRRFCLQKAFQLLRAIDDGKGAGYFLALELGRGLGVPTADTRSEPFQPARDATAVLTGGLAPSFFQDTVRNALQWHAEHPDG